MGDGLKKGIEGERMGGAEAFFYTLVDGLVGGMGIYYFYSKAIKI